MEGKSLYAEYNIRSIHTRPYPRRKDAGENRHYRLLLSMKSKLLWYIHAVDGKRYIYSSVSFSMSLLMQWNMHYESVAIHDASLFESRQYQRKTDSSVLPGHMSIYTRQRLNGVESFRLTKHGWILVVTGRRGSHEKRVRNWYLNMSLIRFKKRLVGYSGAHFPGL